MEQPFQAGPLGRVGEHPPGHGPAVNGAGGVEHLVPPPLAQGNLDVVPLVGSPDLGIGVDDQAAEFAEQPRDKALPAADAAGDADDGEAMEHGEEKRET